MPKESEADVKIGQPLYKSFALLRLQPLETQDGAISGTNSRTGAELLKGIFDPVASPAIDCRTPEMVPNNQPTPDVIAMASAPRFTRVQVTVWKYVPNATCLKFKGMI
jgi:hypothetical protein